MKLSRERLMEVISYNPETGDFVRLMSRSNAIKSGSPAGWVLKAGYRVMHVNGRIYRASRLAWLYMTGEWPKYEVDHIDGNPINDSWHNLREATHQQNSFNRKRHMDNKSGFKGVVRARKRWAAFICLDGKRKYLGTFDTPEEASVAYNQRAAQLFGKFVRGE